jgi:hypothetical protein
MLICTHGRRSACPKAIKKVDQVGSNKYMFCSHSSEVQGLGHGRKWGKVGETVKCGCGKMVKLRRTMNGSYGQYVQVPRHKRPEVEA